MNPQSVVQLKAFVGDFHRQAGDRFKPENIFTSDCVSCHGDRAKGKSGELLYAAVCRTCHRAGATAAVLDDAYMATQTSETVRSKIAKGVGGMHGFAVAHGGPLNDRQIASLMTYLSSHSNNTPQKHGKRP